MRVRSCEATHRAVSCNSSLLSWVVLVKIDVANRKQRYWIFGAIALVVVTIGGITAANALQDGKKSPLRSLADGISDVVQPKEEKPELFPLTGLPSNGDPKAKRPAIVVKIDNSPEARPQYGIEAADIYLEEKVEGGITRIISIFQSADSNSVGPVRSLRSTDIYALEPMGGGVITFSGGIQPFKDMLGRTHLHEFSEDTKPGVFSRMRGRPYVHSLTTSTTQIRTQMPADAPSPRPFFSYAKPGAALTGAGVVPASSISVKVSNATTIGWTWDAQAKVMKRSINGGPHNLTSGQIAVQNAVVQFIDYRGTPYRDRANTVVDEGVLVGEGDVWVFSGGQLVKGRWSRASDTEPTIYKDAAGNVIELAPGKTWVTFAPKNVATSIN